MNPPLASGSFPPLSQRLLTYEQAVARAREFTRAPSRFGRLRWRDLDAPGPEHSFIIDGFLTMGDKSIIGGPSGSGKSFLAIHAGMSIAIATIRPEWTFFGQKVMRPGLVVYQAGEGARGIKKRLRAFRRHFDVPSDVDLPFELLQSSVDLYNPQGDTEKLIEEIATIRADYPAHDLVAIFIDTLATATGGADENSGKDMNAVMQNIDKLRAATGANVCLVHHLNAAGTKLRGHTSIFANIDQVITVAKNEENKVRTVALGKQKDDDDSLTIKFELPQVETGRYRKEDGKPETSCVCVNVGEKDALRKAEAQAGFRLAKQEEHRIFGALLAALAKYGRFPTVDEEKAGVPTDVKVVDYLIWRDIYAERNPDDNGEKPSTKTIGQRWRNSSEALIRFDVIGLKSPLMWWTGKAVKGFRETQPRANTGPIRGQYRANEGPTDEIASMDPDTIL